VELPSQLFEAYARDFRVVSRFATHHTTGKPIPEAVFRAEVEDEGRFGGLNMIDNLVQVMILHPFSLAHALAAHRLSKHTLLLPSTNKGGPKLSVTAAAAIAFVCLCRTAAFTAHSQLGHA
jgi:hypothetical protein